MNEVFVSRLALSHGWQIETTGLGIYYDINIIALKVKCGSMAFFVFWSVGDWLQYGLYSGITAHF